MLPHSKQFLDIVIEHLESLPQDVKINPAYGFLTAMLAEYCVLKLSAEIDNYVTNNKDRIRNAFGNVGKDEVLAKCRHIKDSEGKDCFSFTETSTITQVKNIRNQLIAHNPNTIPINIEQVRIYYENASSFLTKFDTLI